MKAVNESSHSLLLAIHCLSDPFLQKQRLGGGKQGKGLFLKVHIFKSPSRSWLSWALISFLSSPTSVSIETSQQHLLSRYPEVFRFSQCQTCLGKPVEDNGSAASVLRSMLLASYHNRMETKYIKQRSHLYHIAQTGTEGWPKSQLLAFSPWPLDRCIHGLGWRTHISPHRLKAIKVGKSVK